MKSRSDKPTLQVVMRGGTLFPVTRYDAELLETYSTDQIFNIQACSQRSEPHHKFYWVILNSVVENTQKWATTSHLHDDIKILCGYYRTVINQGNGQVYYVADSIAFNKMDQQEFKIFFESAMQKLSEALGYDPMELLNE